MHKLTSNEKKIITILNREGRPLSKRELAEKGKMGWATVVKMVDRLASQNILQTNGVPEKKKWTGRYPYSYVLSDSYPIAIGVDIEYSTTTLIITNLIGQVKIVRTIDTPSKLDLKSIQSFLEELLTEFIERNIVDESKLVGIGIGTPAIEQTLDSKMDYNQVCQSISSFLEQSLRKKVVVDINVRAYAKFFHWHKKPFSGNDFILLTIRSGIGCAIILDNEHYLGHQGFAGRIGHFKFKKTGMVCHCGDKNCVQTVINHKYLYHQYLSKVLKQEGSPSATDNETEFFKCVSDLFSLAANKNTGALDIVKDFTHNLGFILSFTILVTNVPNIIISGYFGPDGDIILDSLTREIRRHLFPEIDFTLHYAPIIDIGFAKGAALLVFKDYFTPIPS